MAEVYLLPVNGCGTSAGALEARTYGKRILFAIKSCVSRQELERLTGSVQPDMLARKVSC